MGSNPIEGAKSVYPVSLRPGFFKAGHGEMVLTLALGARVPSSILGAPKKFLEEIFN